MDLKDASPIQGATTQLFIPSVAGLERCVAMHVYISSCLDDPSHSTPISSSLGDSLYLHYIRYVDWNGTTRTIIHEIGCDQQFLPNDERTVSISHGWNRARQCHSLGIVHVCILAIADVAGYRFGEWIVRDNDTGVDHCGALGQSGAARDRLIGIGIHNGHCWSVRALVRVFGANGESNDDSASWERHRVSRLSLLNLAHTIRIGFCSC